MKNKASTNQVKRLVWTVAVCALSSVSQAGLDNGRNWADSVVSYTSQIQNYDGILMDASTEYWLLGPSDTDRNGNMYAFDWGIDQMTNAGWKAADAAQEIVVKFDTALTDVAGDDLVIRLFCGPKADASVYVSEDGTNWIQLDSIVGAPQQDLGTPGMLVDVSYDFEGLEISGVHYVKVYRETTGSGTGMFFDSFGSAVPEPATLLLLGLGAACLRKQK